MLEFVFSFLKKLLYRLRGRLPRTTFIKLHWAYFLSTCLIFSGIFWASSTPHSNVSYINSLVLVVAAMTQAGINPVNLSSLNTFEQAVLFGLIICGNQIFVSAVVVHIRKRAFEKRFKKLAQAQEKRRKERKESSGSDAFPESPCTYTSPTPFDGSQTLHCAKNSSHNSQLRAQPSLPAVNIQIPNETKNEQPRRMSVRDGDDITLQGSEQVAGLNFISDTRIQCNNPQHNHLLMHGTVNRNAQFYGLSAEEREHVRCVEYHAVRLLSYLVPAYYVVLQVFGCLAIGAYMSYDKASVALENGLNPWWVGIFFGVAAFNNAGMSLLDLSAVPFQTSVYPLITFSILMMAGNTAYPVFLRLTLWTTLKLLPDKPAYKNWGDTIHFILRYPRRVYTNLFPAAQTWWLALLLVVLNGIDWVAFEVLNRDNPIVTSIPLGYRIMDGLFQSFAVRSSGFTVISISNLAFGLQTLYVMMMYISAFPVVITMRNSNVYEERSLGIYAADIRADVDSKKDHNPNTNEGKPIRRTRLYFLREQVQRQLGHDIWFIIICVILVVWIETPSISADPVAYSIFNIIFEVVSAYGCVGLSVGAPGQDYSFSGVWHTSAKLILCGLMLRGRHRGLPVEIDKAIELPGEKQEEDEEREEMGGRGERRRDSEKEGV